MTRTKKVTSIVTVVAALAALTACTGGSATGGSLTGHVDVMIQDDKSTAELGVQLQLDFTIEAAESDRNAVDEPQADPNLTQVKSILDLIGLTEGTDRGDGYNETLACGAFTNGDVILTDMTLAEIDKLQTAMLRHPNNHWNSSAIGRYQIVRTTLRVLKRKLNLADDLKFTADLQDRLAMELLKGRGLAAWTTGSLSDRQFMLNLSKEWASLPNPDTGKGFYSGQNAAVSVATVKKALDEMR